MAHVNAELAQNLVRWEKTGDDATGAVADGKRKGFVEVKDGTCVVSAKGRAFISKWAAARGRS